MLRLLKLSRQLFRRSSSAFSSLHSQWRCLADTPPKDLTSKEVRVQQVHGTENEHRVRVRRARPADIPRVLRFVREHARVAWPCLGAQYAGNSVSGNLVLCDYVARALAQGHSMLAEQQQCGRAGWCPVRGVALCAAVCAWDAALLQRWARCVRGAGERRFAHFAAHCLRAPKLHHKYRVHNILQVTLLVPPETPRGAEVTRVLAQNAIRRGRDVGIPLLRFDVTTNDVASALEPLQLKKEWHLAYDILPDGMYALKESDASRQESDASRQESAAERPQQTAGNFIAAYSTFTQPQTNTG